MSGFAHGEERARSASVSDPSTNGNGLELENLGEAKTPGSTSPKMLVPLFLVPLVIVAVIVALFLALGSVLGREKSVEQWIQEFETGGVNERWQAAAQLSDLARTAPEKLEDPAIRAKLRHLFTSAGPAEPRIRQYLAQLWATLGDPEAGPLIIDGITRTKELLAHPEQHMTAEVEAAKQELTFYVRALGGVGNSTAEAELLRLAGDPDVAVRQSVAEALGVHGRKTILAGGAVSPAVITTLQRLQQEPDAWVQMNAALSLGKLGRTDGIGTLQSMLDRDWLRRQQLKFPDDGKYSVNDHDPAEKPIASALIVLEALLAGGARVEGPPIDRAALRAAVEPVVAGPNAELARRAKALLAKLET